MEKFYKYLIRIMFVFLCLIAWEVLVTSFKVSEFLLPKPSAIFQDYLSLSTNRLLFHTVVTLVETLSGFLIGVVIGTVLGYLMAKSKVLDNLFSPLVISLQTTPKLALAPLFLIWFGFGLLSKTLITALVVFFPIFINTTLAIKSVNSNLKDLLILTGANKWQILWKLELPSSLPLIFAGLKSGITLAVVGAVVGEFIGAKAGLGYLIIYSTGHLDTATVFVAIFQLAVLGLVLYEIVSQVGAKITRWHESGKEVY